MDGDDSKARDDTCESLVDLALELSSDSMNDLAQALVCDGQLRYRTVDCFDFVPSNYQLAWQVLDQLPRGRFCEWGSGFGIATGIAELLGFEACGIELDPTLAEAARQLLRDHRLSARILTGSYFELRELADVYYVYCWPGMIERTEQLFLDIAPQGSKLVICYGQDVLRCKIRNPILAADGFGLQ